MAHFFYTLFLLFDVITTIFGLKERNRASCSLVKSKIFCFGGGTERMQDPSLLNDHFSLDLESYFETNKAVDIYTIPIPNTNDYILEKRWGQTSSPVSFGDDAGYVVTMGSAKNRLSTNNLQNKTILYSPNNGTWTTIPTPSSTISQAFALSSVLDTNGIMWLYGGVIPMDNQTMVLDSLYNDLANSTNVTLPKQLYGLNTKNWQWTIRDLPTQYDTRADHGAALTNDNKMYIIGGMTIKSNTPPNQSRTYLPMNQILVFDTVNQNWKQITTQGPTPSSRRAFTLDYLPNQNQFVVYGGVYDSGNRTTGRNVSADICYTLNVSTSTWIYHDLHSLNTRSLMGAGQIYGHSSIIYHDHLFLIFGVDEDNTYRDDINILNTLTWQWVTQNGTPPTIWTTGPLIGLVFGILGAVLIIIGLICYLKRSPKGNTPSDEFVIDSTDDPRLRVAVDPIYINSTTEGDDRTQGTTKIGDSLPSQSGSDSLANEKQQQNQNRHLSGATLFGSAPLAKVMAHRPLSSMSQCMNDSSFTSFSGTTATKPDLLESPPTPSSPYHPPSNDRNKPDGHD